MGEGEKEQEHKSKLGRGDKATDLQAIPGGTSLGTVSEMSWDQVPFPLPSQDSPVALGSSSRQVSLRFLLVSALVLPASQATQQLCQGTSFPITRRELRRLSFIPLGGPAI